MITKNSPEFPPRIATIDGVSFYGQEVEGKSNCIYVDMKRPESLLEWQKCAPMEHSPLILKIKQ